ncbi:hypothetical protein BB560_005061 [Smittium megazygosporum]|uniref:Lipoyl synthase, mitochondrial n=1 Tax=Smittium megazygosporum TaxID=133381 RepID=A0A2T9Z7I7_9FUNG|nr:hypothetical protein BB560_005061 [Smittium megazygosporum]
MNLLAHSKLVSKSLYRQLAVLPCSNSSSSSSSRLFSSFAPSPAPPTLTVPNTPEKRTPLSQKLEAGPSFSDFINSNLPGDSRLPPWLKTPIPKGRNVVSKRKSLKSFGLSTVCEEAKCPNISECWGGGEHGTSTATIMIMGDTCTRACRFCSVKTSRAPPPLDPNEPANVANALADWGLDYVVLTSVDRDDLPDFGADHFTKVVQQVKAKLPDMMVECLTPDFLGNPELVLKVASSGLDVFAHNVETVEELTKYVRDRRANYNQSLQVLKTAKQGNPDLLTKTSIMLGVGENDEMVHRTLKDIADAGVDIVTFGQYIRPTRKHMKVVEYIHPSKFDYWKEQATSNYGFKFVASGPLVRSSYKAAEFFVKSLLKNKSSS